MGSLRKVVREQKVQNKIIEYLEGKGAYVVKTINTTRAGVPDLLVCYKGEFIGLEVKSDIGDLSMLQEYNLRKIENCGGRAFCVRGVEDVEGIIENKGY